MSEKPSPKSPSMPTVKRLFALSGNRCPFPDCSTSLVDQETGSVVSQVCHIKGEKPSAPRYDDSQDNNARHGFDNLILLCNVHHKVIDDSPEEYPVERLVAMKEDHETRQDGKEPIDNDTAEAFTSAVMNYFVEQGDVVHATNVSGGQVAHTINNLYPPHTEPETVQIEGTSTISAGGDLLQSVGCPCLILSVVCRSKRPAKIRGAKLSLIDQGIIAALEAGFDESMDYTPLPGSDEELTIHLFAMQEPNAYAGFVLQQDDSARFLLPILAAPIGLFLIRPADASSIKVEFFDESEQVVIDGNVLRGQLEDLVSVAKKMPCEAKFPTVKMNVKVESTTMPSPGPVGKLNPNPIHFGLRVHDPSQPAHEKSKVSENSDGRWYERSGEMVGYPELLQGRLPLCVYAAIAGAVNHIAQREVWKPEDVFNEHHKGGAEATNFGVADTALKPVGDIIEKHHHNKDTASQSLTPKKIREWIDDDGVVILSMELRNDPVSQRGGWHMFSLMAYEDDRFQVWDTNGLKGFLTDEEITNGFHYPNGWFFMPHDKEDTLVLRRKK